MTDKEYEDLVVSRHKSELGAMNRLCRRINKLENKQGMYDNSLVNIWDRIEMLEKVDVEPEPPKQEPIKAGDWVVCIDDGLPPYGIPTKMIGLNCKYVADEVMEKAIRLRESGFIWRKDRFVKTTAPECVCEARKREEEAELICFVYGNCYKIRSSAPYCDCIHCGGQIKKSLIGDK